MADGGRRPRRGLGVPRRPRLGLDEPVRPGPRRARASRTRAAAGSSSDVAEFDAGVLRDLAPRGAGDGPAAAAAAGASWEALERAGIDPRLAARHARPACSPAIVQAATAMARADGDLEGYRLTGMTASVDLGPGGLHARAGGPGGDGGHGVLVVAGGAAPGGAGAALRRVRPGAGRRRDRDGHAGDVRRSSAGSAGWPPDGRCKAFAAAADGVGLGRGRRRAGGGAAVGRAAERAPGAGGGARAAR